MTASKSISIFLAFALVAMALCASISCNRGTIKRPDEKVKVIADTDICSSTDDLVMLHILYKLSDEGKIDFKAHMISRQGDENLRMADLLNCYYGHEEVMIGQPENAPEHPVVFIDYGSMVQQGKFRESLSAKQRKNLPYAHKLYREILSQSEDHSVHIFATGFAVNIANLLQSTADEYSELDGVELVRRKVAAFHIQAGQYGKYTEPDYNFSQDPDHALCFITMCPSPIYISPMEAGQLFDYKPEWILSDLEQAGRQDGVLHYVYSHYDCDTGQRMWDVMTILQWLHPELYLETETHYTIDSEMILKPCPGKKSHFLEYPKDSTSQKEIMSLVRELTKL